MKKIFNDIAFEKETIKNIEVYIERLLEVFDGQSISRKFLYDLIISCNYAFEEVHNKKKFLSRPLSCSSTYLKIFNLRESSTNRLDLFLRDVVNPEEVRSLFLNEKGLVLFKLPLFNNKFKAYIMSEFEFKVIKEKFKNSNNDINNVNIL